MEITDIKERLTIREVVKRYGHSPNRNNLIKCPFHDDKTPSLQLYPKTNTWYCFGCGKGTDQIDFIQHSEACTTHQAIEKAKSFVKPYHGTAQSRQSKNKTDNNMKTTNKLSPDQRRDTLTKAFGYFVRGLKSSEKAKAYMKRRALDTGKLTAGYDNQNFYKKATAEAKQHYLSTGLIYPDKTGRTNYHHSFFSGCIVFPIVNENGEIVNLYGRCTDDTKNNRHRYLPGHHQGIYPRYPKPRTQHLIITESIIDCATLLQLKRDNEAFKNTYELMACYGTNNLTAEHRQAIRELKHLKEIIFMFDNDEAGNKAVEQYSRELKTENEKWKISNVALPCKDVNETYISHDPEIFTHLLNERTFIFSPEKKASQISDEKKNTEPSPGNDQFSTFNFSLNTENPEQLIYQTDSLTITIWGGIDIHTLNRLRATLHIQVQTLHATSQHATSQQSFRDTVDLYSHSQTQRLIREASETLNDSTDVACNVSTSNVSTVEISQTITALTKALEQYRQDERDNERKRQQEERNKNRETFTKHELQQGEQFLKDNKLMEKTEQHIKNIGLVGEEDKGMLLFFILLTRKFKEPLHALVQGKSGSGKTYLLKKIAGLIPKAHIRITTALTENTLYHSLKDFWKHMILLIEDLDGAFNALLPLREMMSNQSISKYSTEKNIKTGEFEPRILHVEGPVCVAGATTKDKLYEDNANRSFLIQVNESPQHQEKVMEYQRKEIAGLLDKRKERQAQTTLKTAQLHLEPMEVVIPFGNELRIPDYVFKKLRTNAHYLTLIKAIAFWHQKQREVKQKQDGTRYIEATLDDVAWANKLSKDVLLRKSDELNGNLRNFFESLKTHLRKEDATAFFSGKIRERFRMHPQQLKRYLIELSQRGYIKQVGNNRKTGYEYEVKVWDDYEVLQSGINVLDKVLEELKQKYKKP